MALRDLSGFAPVPFASNARAASPSLRSPWDALYASTASLSHWWHWNAICASNLSSFGGLPMRAFRLPMRAIVNRVSLLKQVVRRFASIKDA